MSAWAVRFLGTGIMAQDNDKSLLRRRKMQETWLAREDRRRKGWSRPWLPSRREYEREETLIDFVGEERAPSVFASLRSAFHDAGQIASSFVENLDLKSKMLLDDLAKNWADLVGKDNAGQCRPLEFKDGTLSIEVFSSSWFFVLNGYKSLITKRISDFTGGEVARIYFVQQGTTRKTRGV